MIKDIKAKLRKYTTAEKLLAISTVAVAGYITKDVLFSLLVLLLVVLTALAVLLSVYVVVVAWMVAKESYLLLTHSVGTGLTSDDVTILKVYDKITKFLGR